MLFRTLSTVLFFSMGLMASAQASDYWPIEMPSEYERCLEYASPTVCQNGRALLHSAQIVFPARTCSLLLNQAEGRSGLITTNIRTSASVVLTMDSGEKIEIPVSLSTSGIGLRAFFLVSNDDCAADLNGLTGMMSDGKLSSIFGNYVGVGAGAAAAINVGFQMVANSSGIWIGSTSAGVGFGVDLSAIKIRMTPRHRLPQSVMDLQFE